MRPLLVFIGPSGVGKSTLVRQLVVDRRIRLLRTWTTRPLRQDETAGVSEHCFVSDKQFDNAISSGELIDSLPTMFGLAYRYGLPKLDTSTSGPIETLMCRADLLKRLRLHTQDFLVYQIETDPQVARARLEEREREGAELGTRWEQFNDELTLGRAVAQRCFINDGSPEGLCRQVEQALAKDYP